jgi:hypothetical protein
MTNANVYAQGNQIVVLPDGTLVDDPGDPVQGLGIQPNQRRLHGRDALTGRRSTGASPRRSRHSAPWPDRATASRCASATTCPTSPSTRKRGAVRTWATGSAGRPTRSFSRSTTAASTGTTPTIVSHHDTAQFVQPRRSTVGQRRRARRALLRHRPQRGRARPTASHRRLHPPFRPTVDHLEHPQRSSLRLRTGRSPADTSSATTTGLEARVARRGLIAFLRRGRDAPHRERGPSTPSD